MRPLSITCFGIVSALGHGSVATAEALRHERSGLQRNDYPHTRIDTWIGRVDGVEDCPITGPLDRFDCRNNRLAELALQSDGFHLEVAAARERYGANRIGVFLGTSTSGCLETELAYRRRDPATGALPATLDYRRTHNLYSVTDYTRQRLGLRGPGLTISTACSSSAKAFATASRHIAGGFCDAAIVGGADSLCLNTLQGFASLELTSPQPCRPFDALRDGISIGEAAGFMLLESQKPLRNEVEFAGYGESSDAYHMAAPHPDGVGAAAAMRGALTSAALDPVDVDYINAHGTGTLTNDRAEALAVSQLFGPDTPVSSTKGWTGHALGAAGVIEAIISCIALREGLLPGTLNTETVDPDFSCNVLGATSRHPLRTVLSNSFGFGGTNCSLVFRRAA